MNLQQIIQPYYAGKNKMSVAMILPSKFVKSHRIDPSTVLLLLRSDGSDSLQLKILREEDLNKKEETGKETPVGAGISL